MILLVGRKELKQKKAQLMITLTVTGKGFVFWRA